ncbi:MAG: flotillin family protein, partial [Eubacterium sp.]|nr:flotillin family protein [Eubacterium sp.]
MNFQAVLPYVGIVVGIIVILAVILSMWKKVPQDKAGVVTGMKRRVITGGGGIVIPVFERIDYISLGNIPLSVTTKGSLSSQGVPINVITTAVIKVRNTKEDILTAIEQFVGKNEEGIAQNINETATAVLEGKLREIIATMTVEELYQKREDFSSKVQEVVGTELGNMGLEVKN